MPSPQTGEEEGRKEEWRTMTFNLLKALFQVNNITRAASSSTIFSSMK
eukprot:gene31856-40199_t